MSSHSRAVTSRTSNPDKGSGARDNSKSLKATGRGGSTGQAVAYVEPSRLKLPTNEQLSTPEGVVRVIASIGSSMRQARRAYRDGIYNDLARSCAVGAYLSAHASSWKSFCQDKFWIGYPDRPTTEQIKLAVKYVLIRAEGSTARLHLQRANKHYHAVLPLIRRGITPADIPAHLKARGGVQKVAQANVEKKCSDSTETTSNERGKDEQEGSTVAPKGSKGKPKELILKEMPAECDPEMRRLSKPCRMWMDFRSTPGSNGRPEITVLALVEVDDDGD